jgi:pyruvate dehydrogenase E1 component alpha subunit
LFFVSPFIQAANMAKLWNLPAVFVCENNRYGMGTQVQRSSANTDYYKAGGVIIPGVKADGMDYMAVRECFKFIKEFCGNGGGPIFCELATYRYHGHSMSDPGTTYRDRQEVQDIRASRDPIEQVKKYIIEAGFTDEADLVATEKAIRKEVTAANKRAKEGKEPELKELLTDILSDGAGGSEIPDFIRMPRYDLSHRN